MCPASPGTECSGGTMCPAGPGTECSGGTSSSKNQCAVVIIGYCGRILGVCGQVDSHCIEVSSIWNI